MLPRIRPKSKFKLNRRNSGDLRLKSPFFSFMKTLQGHRRGGEEDVLGCSGRVDNAFACRCRIGNVIKKKDEE